KYPDATISVYCKPMNNSLVEQTGCVQHIINAYEELEKHYDIQVDFRGDNQTLVRPLLGQCKIYLDRGSVRLRNKFSGGQRHEVETNQETIKWLLPQNHVWGKPNLKVSPSDEAMVDALLKSDNIEQYVVMHCGARDAARRWPADRFAALIDAIFDKYKLPTVLVGSANENDLIDTVATQTARAYNYAGKTNLLQLTALIRRSKLFVGNESGPLHFAIVAQKPLVALFGPGVKDVFYPLYPNQKVIHHVIENQLQGDKETSMFQIQQQDVLDAIAELTF
ncbi:MAG: ADP-heptose:LPS heptosyltransferase, partial [Bacteroidia bacterium]